MGRFVPDKVEVLALDRPGPRLIEHLRGADTVLLIDAVMSGSRPGTLHRLEGHALSGWVTHHASSHGFGLAETLALAEKLGELPAHLKFLGLEAGAKSPSAGEIAHLVSAVALEVESALNAMEKSRQA
jgi:hydrogenase maturation protease